MSMLRVKSLWNFYREGRIKVAILPLFDKSDFNASDVKNELSKLATVAEA